MPRDTLHRPLSKDLTTCFFLHLFFSEDVYISERKGGNMLFLFMTMWLVLRISSQIN